MKWMALITLAAFLLLAFDSRVYIHHSSWHKSHVVKLWRDRDKAILYLWDPRFQE